MSGGNHPKIPESPTTGSVPEFGYSDVEQGERIGTGGDADVYRATVKKDGYSGTVALKTPRFEGTVSKQVVERFEKEAETWDKLSDGENVVSVYSWGTEPIPWLALEYMDGGTLESKIGEVGVEEALWVSGRVADGVYHGHRHGVAHLDIKPTNVLLRETGAGTWNYPKVSDWGLAKMLLDHSNSIEGISPTYAAPEQFDSEQYGATDDITDVYQIGAVAYALLTGEPPFTGSSAAVMQGVLQEEPTPPSVANPDVPREVDEIVMKALSKEKGDRYESSVILRKELDGLFEGYVDGSLGASGGAGAEAGGSAASGGSADRGGSGRKTGVGTDTRREETSDSRTEPRSTAEAESQAETDRRSRERKDRISNGGVLTRRRALGLLGIGVGSAYLIQTNDSNVSDTSDGTPSRSDTEGTTSLGDSTENNTPDSDDQELTNDDFDYPSSELTSYGWTVDGAFSIDDSQITADYAGNHFISHPIRSFTGTWRIEGVQNQNDGRGLQIIFANNSEFSTDESTGYRLKIRQLGDGKGKDYPDTKVALIRLDENDGESLIDPVYNHNGNTHDYRIERDQDGRISLFADGEELGEADDSTYTDISYLIFRFDAGNQYIDTVVHQ